MNGKNKTAIIILAIFLLTVLILGCLDKNTGSNKTNGTDVWTGDGVPLASFYINDFNEEKANDPEVMDVLKKILYRYDIVAVQGIKDPEAIRLLVEELNTIKDENGNLKNYQYNISEPVGRTEQTREQYAFVYNRNVVYPASYPRLYSEQDGDIFEREPYGLVFRPYDGTNDCLFLTVHVDENNVQAEIAELSRVIERGYSDYPGQTNITVMGNFYSDAPYFTESDPQSFEKYYGFVCLTPDDAVTTVVGNYTYDRIIISGNLQKYLIGNNTVFNFSKEFGLNETQSLAVSSHYPVETVFAKYPAEYSFVNAGVTAE